MVSLNGNMHANRRLAMRWELRNGRRPLLAAVAVLVAATSGASYRPTIEEIRRQSGASDRPTVEEIRRQDWFLNGLYDRGPHLCRLLITEEGWQVEIIMHPTRLRYSTTPMTDELLIPLFPTVYAPTPLDKGYYDTILNSDIQQGDKVLVIGTGSSRLPRRNMFSSSRSMTRNRCRASVTPSSIGPTGKA